MPKKSSLKPVAEAIGGLSFLELLQVAGELATALDERAGSGDDTGDQAIELALIMASWADAFDG